MKNQSRFAPFFLTLVLAAAPMLQAQPAEEQKAPRGPGGPGGRGANLEVLAQELGLTEDQKAKLGPILKQQMEQMQALRKDESLSQDQRREKGRALREAGQKEIAVILTPEQAKKMAELRAQGPRGERPGQGGKGGMGEKPADK